MRNPGTAARIAWALAFLAIAHTAVAAEAETAPPPIRMICTYDAVGQDPAYDVVVGFDEKSRKFYTSRGGKIAGGSVTPDEVRIIHMVTPPDGVREVTVTTIDRLTGKIVLTREGGGVLGTGTCKKVE
jgi:hypothetical protein